MSSESKTKVSAPGEAFDAVLGLRGKMPEGSEEVKGYDFNQGVNFEKLLDSYLTSGYQATNFGKAVEEIRKMIKWRLQDEPITENETEDFLDPAVRSRTRAKIFFGYTSNLISSGVRDTIRYLCQNKMVDVIVSTAGGIEEDFIKCLAPTFLGDFSLNGTELRKKGLNRIGNLIVPNDNYCKFEDWIMPIFDQMVKEQNENGVRWTPSKVIHRLGKEINHPDSVYYWCYQNNIPVYSPALTDGSIGDMLYFHSYRNLPENQLTIDLVADIRGMNNEAVYAKKTGVIILGGGLIKHHILNANLMRNGADFAVLVNTAQEFDGSDAGARPDEAISWGKLRLHSNPVKIYAEASLVFPLLIAQTFAKEFEPKE
eukprot:GCRY01002445.1.p1 GENE.GCRY01002445.1~~GCRY01002445.1.p1  ORF type:complete len:370 (-),score=63.00 GCRY01002445.1:27-1136(-)